MHVELQLAFDKEKRIAKKIYIQKIVDKSINFVYTNRGKELKYMNAIIQKWGNSQGIRIPKSILETALFKPNDTVDIIAEDNKIIIKKVVHKKHITLEERLKDFNGEYIFEEVDWGKPMGNEIW